jgi:hypothetical protein
LRGFIAGNIWLAFALLASVAVLCFGAWMF